MGARFPHPCTARREPIRRPDREWPPHTQRRSTRSHQRGPQPDRRPPTRRPRPGPRRPAPPARRHYESHSTTELDGRFVALSEPSCPDEMPSVRAEDHNKAPDRICQSGASRFSRVFLGLIPCRREEPCRWPPPNADVAESRAQHGPLTGLGQQWQPQRPVTEQGHHCHRP